MNTQINLAPLTKDDLIDAVAALAALIEELGLGGSGTIMLHGYDRAKMHPSLFDLPIVDWKTIEGEPRRTREMQIGGLLLIVHLNGEDPPKEPFRATESTQEQAHETRHAS